jgi:hypothetical protein
VSGTEGHDISSYLGRSVEMDPHISELCVLSTGSTKVRPISAHSVHSVEISLFSVKSGLLTDAPSSSLFTVATDSSQISALNQIIPSYQYV